MGAADLANWESGMDGIKDLFLCDSLIENPSIYVPNIHVFDEAQLEAVYSCELDEPEDFIVVGARDKHGIQFNGRHRPLRSSDNDCQHVIAVGALEQDWK